MVHLTRIFARCIFYPEFLVSSVLSGGFVFDPDLGFEVASVVQADLQSGTITVPEPGILLLFITGLLGMGILRKIKAIPARQ